MRMRSLLASSSLALSLLAAACGGGAKSASTMPGGAEASCEQVGAHVSGMMAKAAGADAPADQVAKFQAVFATSCTTDGWSAEVRTCFMGLDEKADPGVCGDKLTPEQQKALADRVAAELGEAPTTSAPGGAEGGGGEKMMAPSPEPTTGADPCDGGE